MRFHLILHKFKHFSRRRFAATILMLILLLSTSGFLLVKYAFGATRTWDGGGTDLTCGGGAGDGNKWSCAANWSSDTAPGTLDIAQFDGTSSKAATIDAAIDVGGINITAAYGGIITQGSGNTINVRGLDWIQAGGTFTGGNSAITVGASNITLSGGTFTNTSSTLTWTITGTSKAFNITGSTFSNPGTIKFADANLSTQTFTCSGTVNGTVDIAQTSGNATFSLSSNCNLTLATTVTTNGTITNGGTINATDINITDQINANTPNFNQNGTLNMTGTLKFTATHTGSQTLSCTGNLTNSGGVVDIVQSNSSTSFTLGVGCIITLASSVSTTAPVTNNGTMNGTTFSMPTFSNSFVNNGTLSLTTLSLGKNFTNGVGATATGTLILDDVTSGITQNVSCTGILRMTIDVKFDGFNNGTLDVGSGCTATLIANDYIQGSLIVDGTLIAGDFSISRDITINGILNSNGTLIFDDTTSGLTQDLTCKGVFPMTIDVKFDGFQNGTLSVNSGCAATLISNDIINGNLIVGGKLTAGDFSVSRDVTITGTLNSSGTLTLDDGTSGFTQDLTCSGTFPMAVDVKFDTFNNGTLSIPAGCEINEVTSDTIQGNAIIDGKLNASGLTIERDFTLGANATFTGSLTFTSANSNTLTCTNKNLSTNITVNKTLAGNSFILGSSCNVVDFTLSQGTVTNPASKMTLSMSGNFAQNANTAIGGANLILEFSGSGSQTISKTTGTIITPINVNKTGGSVSLSTTLGTSAAATVSAGFFDINGQTFTTPQSFTIQDGGGLKMIGSETPKVPTLNSGSTVSYKGAAGTNSYTIKNYSYSNFEIAQAAGANTFNLPNDLTIGGNVNIIAGTLDTASGSNFNLTVAGNWGNAGTFTARSGTVTFNDNSKPSIITGTTTFNNLTSTTANKRFVFANASTQTISGALTLTGARGQNISLTSKTAGTQWNIVSNGTASLTFLEVKDSNACSGTTLVPTNSTNLGNNSCWTMNASTGTNDIKINAGTKINQGSIIRGL